MARVVAGTRGGGGGGVGGWGAGGGGGGWGGGGGGGGGGENRPHSMFSPIKRERIKIETSGFQYLQVEAFATSDQKMEVKVIIGHEI